jgi:hypothetical protein
MQMRLQRTWRESLLSAVEAGSDHALACRPLWVKKLDAQGLLCPSCGMELGTGVVLVRGDSGRRLRPCPECARHRFDEVSG